MGEELRAKGKEALGKLRQRAFKYFMRFVGDNETPKDTGPLYTFLLTEVKQVMLTACAGSTRSCCRLIDGLLSDFSSDFTVDPETLGRFAESFGRRQPEMLGRCL